MDSTLNKFSILLITIILFNSLIFDKNFNLNNNYFVEATNIDNENINENLNGAIARETIADTMMTGSSSSNNENIPIIPSSSTSLIKVETRGVEKQRYCGENLIKVLALYCKGYYAKKRSMMTSSPMLLSSFNDETMNSNYNDDNSNLQHFYRQQQQQQQQQQHELSSNDYDDSSNYNELAYDDDDFKLNDIMNILKYKYHDDNEMDNYDNNNNNHNNEINRPRLQQLKKQQQQKYLSSNKSKNFMDYIYENYLESQIRNEQQRLAAMKPKRGVVDDCCRQPCGAKTLNQYCGIRKRNPFYY